MHLMHLLTSESKLVTSKNPLDEICERIPYYLKLTAKLPENRAESPKLVSGRMSSWIDTHVIGKYLPFVTSLKRKNQVMITEAALIKDGRKMFGCWKHGFCHIV